MGEVKFESDKPAACFSLGFEAGLGLSTDYFFCKECNIKWVCASCSEKCHIAKGHTVDLFLENNSPDWRVATAPRRRSVASPMGRGLRGIINLIVSYGDLLSQV